MSLPVLYLLKCSISLSIVWIFYQLFLRRLTFYSLNRWYLLGYSAMAFFIPLIHLGPIAESDPARQPLIIQFIPTIGDYRIVADPDAGGRFTWNGWNYGLALIALGAVFLLMRLAGRWLSLRRIRQQARLIENTTVRIYQVDEDIIPFSFGNAIYINQHLHTEKEWEEIILHEYVHIRQQHTADILLAELVCILNWYNPFAWLLRHSIRQNLEFIADHKVLENGFDKKNYQYHLLKVIGEPCYRLANNFNFSSLKKRIVMMNKIRSARLHLVKFLFILPLIAVLLLAFRDKYEGMFRRPGGRYIHLAGIVVDYGTRQPLAGASVAESVSGRTVVTDAKGFYSLSIPIPKDSIRINLAFSKEGYSEDQAGHYMTSIKQSWGCIDVGLLVSKSGNSPHFMMKPPYFKKVPEHPSYEDALVVLDATYKSIESLDRFMEMRKAHPDVALFYTTEDKKKHIVILNNGQVERYGYPDGPGVTEMENKYGSLPEMMTPPSGTAGGGYLSQWEKISAGAEKAFHTTNPAALHIIFPGDSRVLVVPASGKPEMYDMDNVDPKERPLFEKLYGKLPDCVPAAADPGRNAVIVNGRRPSPRTDTVPEHKAVSPDSPSRRPITISVLRKGMPANVLYVVNGTPMEAGWKLDSIPTDNISSIDVIKGEEALKVYGERGANGVIDITTKSYLQFFNRLHPLDMEDPLRMPMYIVDGVVASQKALNTINPGAIQSITILKDVAATAKYGENARNGVVLITLKPVSGTSLSSSSDLSIPHHIDVRRDSTGY